MIQKKSSVTAEWISPIFREIILQLHSIKPLLVSHSQIYLHSSVSELENGVTAPIIFLLQGGKKAFLLREEPSWPYYMIQIFIQTCSFSMCCKLAAQWLLLLFSVVKGVHWQIAQELCSVTVNIDVECGHWKVYIYTLHHASHTTSSL